jgi:putative thioredoxin
METHRQGNAADALRMLHEARESDPDNHRIQLDYAAINLELGNLAEAEAALDALPRDIREEAGAVRLYALLGFARLAQDAPTAEELEARITDKPDDMEARHQLAARHVLADRLEPALQELLHILQHDRSYGDDAGRKGMLAVFDLLGNGGDLVADYRRKLFNSMH